MNKRMWAILLHLSMNMWGEKDNFLEFDEDTWNRVVDECEKARINTIILDIGDGMEYKSHPELAIEGAWSQEKMRKEIAKCKAKGITIIPKLNFSATHDQWLGEYERMLSTSIYYKVCKDLIDEVAEVFDHPEYIHVAMDEEYLGMVKNQKNGLLSLRLPDLLMHDIKFFFDCVKKNGATPWIWHCPLFVFPEEFKEHISPDECIISPWHYNSFREDHFTPITINTKTNVYYTSGDFEGKVINWVEEDPFFIRFHEQALPNARLGYKYVPCASVFNECKWNHQDIVEHFRDNAPDGCIQGYMTAPWYATTPEHLDLLIKSVRELDEARRMFYPED